MEVAMCCMLIATSSAGWQRPLLGRQQALGLNQQSCTRDMYCKHESWILQRLTTQPFQFPHLLAEAPHESLPELFPCTQVSHFTGQWQGFQIRIGLIRIRIQPKISMRIRIPEPNLVKIECIYYIFLCSISILLQLQYILLLNKLFNKCCGPSYLPDFKAIADQDDGKFCLSKLICRAPGFGIRIPNADPDPGSRTQIEYGSMRIRMRICGIAG